MTTLPLIWGEAGDVGELLKSEAKPGWVRQELESRFVLEPLDTLDEAALARLDRLVLAQPRALSPDENVALDAWVRGGGKLLLFADPMLTRHSRYPVGDKRRPQDVILLSPILSHWGLELLLDDAQAEGERMIDIHGVEVPVNLPGHLRTVAASHCTIAKDGVLARCSVGSGNVLILADAAVLDDAHDGSNEPPRSALTQLVTLALD